MKLPELVHSLKFIVHSQKKSNDNEPLALSPSNGKTLNRKPEGFTLIELLVACHPKPQRRKAIPGFTLIELLVVISIISILISAAMVSFSVAQTKGRDGKRKADLKGIQQALEQYYQANGKYPDTSGGKIMCNSSNPTDITALDWGRTFICSSITYMAPLPKDPAFDVSSTTDYYYTPFATNQKYMISAKIENSNDPENKGGNPGYVDGTLPCDNATYNGPTSGRTYCVINP